MSQVNSVSAEARAAKDEAMDVMGNVCHIRIRHARFVAPTTIALIVLEFDGAVINVEMAEDQRFYALIGLFLRELDPQFREYFSFFGDRMGGCMGVEAVLHAMELLANISLYDYHMLRMRNGSGMVFVSTGTSWSDDSNYAIYQRRLRCLKAARDLFSLFFVCDLPHETIHSYFSKHHPLVAQTRATLTVEARHKRGDPPPLALPVVRIG